MTGVHLHDHNCGMKLYRREIFDEVRLYGELHRFVPVLAAARGWKAGEIPIQHRPRKFGRSKYGIFRILKGFLDLLTVRFITGYGHRPQHVLGTLGLLGFGLGFGGLLILTALWIVTRFSPLAYWFDPVNLHERAIFFYCICAVILGAQFFSVGFLAEMMAAHNTQGLPPYSIAERTGAPEHGGECDLSEKPETEAKRAETALR